MFCTFTGVKSRRADERTRLIMRLHDRRQLIYRNLAGNARVGPQPK